MSRRPLIAGNWKMHNTVEQAERAIVTAQRFVVVIEQLLA